MISARIVQSRERLALLEARAARAFRTRHDTAAQKLSASARVLESISYRAVLSRGFALVRGEDGKSRRKAAELKPGEALALVFADGEAAAVAAGTLGTKPPKAKKPGGNQGSLF